MSQSWLHYLPFIVAFLALAAVIAGLVVDRRRTNARLAAARTSARQLSGLLDGFDTAWMATMDGGQTWTASQKLQDWLGSDQAGAAAMVQAMVPELKAFATDGEAFEKTVEIEGHWLHLTGRMIKLDNATMPIVRVADASSEIGERQMLLEDRQKLRTALDNCSLLLEAMPFPMWQRDADGAITWVNAAYVTAVGGKDSDAVLQDKVELTSGAMADSLRQEANEVMKAREARSDKHFVVIGDQRRAMLIHTLPLAGGRGTLSYAIDITDTEELGNEISRLGDAHRETLNSMASAVAIYGPDKTLDYYNQAFANLWRLPEDYLEGRPSYDDMLELMRERRLIPEQANFKSWKEERQAHFHNIIEPLEEYWHLPDGRTIRIVTHPHPLGGLLKLSEDVTDKLAMERSFNTLIAVQRETINKLHEAVAVFSSTGELRLHNPAYASLWKLDTDTLDGGPHVTQVLDMCTPLFSNKEERDTLQALILGGQEQREVRRGRLYRSDDTILDFAAVPLPDGGTLLTYVDVTDRLKIERALIDRNEALEAADRLKSEFVAHVSYELRTPINSILGFSEILEAEHFGALNDKQQEYIADILRASKGLRALINDILDLSMIEAGVMTLSPETVSIRDVLDEVGLISERDVADKGLTLEVNCPRNVGSIEGDRKRLVQVMYNLMSNAIKYTPEGGSITLNARRRKDRVEISVKDTGVGISKDEQEKVFQKFHKASADTLRGAGLGLSLVRRFIEMHQGEVTLTSTPTEGTEVTCSLPRQQAAPTWEDDAQSEDASEPALH